MNNNKRTSSYVCTLSPTSVVDKSVLEALRCTISIANVELANYSPKRLRVSVKGRLGKNNPAANDYRTNWDGSINTAGIRLKDAVRLDIYVHTVWNY